MSSHTPTRQEPVKIDGLGRASIALADHVCDRALRACEPRVFDAVEQPDELGERNLAPTGRGQDGRNLASIEPAQERRRSHTQHASGIGRPDRRPDKLFERFSCRRELMHGLGGRDFLHAPKPNETLENL
jgi:hypothetical protein